MPTLKNKTSHVLTFVVILIGTFSGCQLANSQKVKIEITGDGYHWKIRHAGTDGVLHTADDWQEEGDVHIPAGQNVELQITSQDDIYFWTVEDLNLKALAMRKRVEKLENVFREGIYAVDAGQMCGFSHETLNSKLIVLPADEYALLNR